MSCLVMGWILQMIWTDGRAAQRRRDRLSVKVALESTAAKKNSAPRLEDAAKAHSSLLYHPTLDFADDVDERGTTTTTRYSVHS